MNKLILWLARKYIAAACTQGYLQGYADGSKFMAEYMQKELNKSIDQMTVAAEQTEVKVVH